MRLSPWHLLLPALWATSLARASKTFRALLPPGANVSAPLEDGVFWSAWLDARLPEAFGELRARAWWQEARGGRVVALEAGCGRASNRLATFRDGGRACVRYGISEEQVQGETLTYYLAALLGITNVPPLALSRLEPHGEQWGAVRREVDALHWSWGTLVSLTQWVPDLRGVVTPGPLRPGSGGLHPLRGVLANRSTAELLELAQWSDLVVFDYLSGNFDRLVSGLLSLQWDARVLEREASNLQRSPAGALVFVDNEAGLVHGYRVLRLWEEYHDALLRSVCLFRRGTARRLAEMHRQKDAARRLRQLYQRSEPLAPDLGFLSEEHAGILQSRVDSLYKHILECKSKYSPV